MALQIRRGTNSDRLSTRLEQGEISWTTDTFKLYVGDGTTMGGRNALQATAGPGLNWNITTQELELDVGTLQLDTSDVAEATNLYFTNNRAKDAVGPMLQNATTSGITFTYNDISRTISATVDREPVEDKVAPMFTNGTHAGIFFTYTDNGSSAGTLDATVIPEYIEDKVAAMFTAGTQTGVTVTYVDNGAGNGALSIAIEDALATEVSPSLGGNLTLSGHNIVGLGDINITGKADIVNAKAAMRWGTLGAESVNFWGITDGTSGGTAGVGLNCVRGTPLAPLNTAVGDFLGGYAIRGYYNGQYKPGVSIGASWAPTADLTSPVPASRFGVLTGTNTGVNLMQFDNRGVLSAPIMQTGNTYTTSPDTRPTSPVKGMIIFETTTNTFQGWNGTTWATLG